MNNRLIPLTALALLIAATLYILLGPSTIRQTQLLKDDIHTAHEAALTWLTNNMNSKGLFVYLFDPVVGSVSTNNNELRQLMASRALAAASARDERLLVAHQKNLDFIFTNWYKTDGTTGYVLYENKSKLGANAMLLRTLVHSPRFEAYRTEAAALAAGIFSLANTNGLFKPWMVEPSYAYDADYLLTFYSGEALLALAEYYEKTNDRSLLEPIGTIADAYLERYVEHIDEHYYPAYVPWHTMAYAKLFSIMNDTKYAEAIFVLNDKLLELLDDTNTIGQFYNPETPQYGTPHSASDGVYLEGLAYAYDIARVQQDQERIQRYGDALQIATQHLLSLQYKESVPVYAAHPNTYLGAIRIGRDRPSIRVDTTQHALDAFEKLLNVL